MIPIDAVMDSEEIGGAAFRVYAYLCLRRNRLSGICYPKLKTIAHNLKMSPGHASQLKKILIENGWIEECSDGSFRPLKGFAEFRISKQKTPAKSLDNLNKSLDNLNPSLDILNKSLDILNNNNNIDINRPFNREKNIERGANKSRQPAQKGKRLPVDFVVSEEMRTWATDKHPQVDIDAETEAFVDYWRGVSGARGTKLDWVATWRNWIRRSKQFNRTGNGKQTYTEIMEDYARLDAKWAAEEEAARGNHSEKPIGNRLPRLNG